MKKHLLMWPMLLLSGMLMGLPTFFETCYHSLGGGPMNGCQSALLDWQLLLIYLGGFLLGLKSALLLKEWGETEEKRLKKHVLTKKSEPPFSSFPPFSPCHVETVKAVWLKSGHGEIDDMANSLRSKIETLLSSSALEGDMACQKKLIELENRVVPQLLETYCRNMSRGQKTQESNHTISMDCEPHHHSEISKSLKLIELEVQAIEAALLEKSYKALRINENFLRHTLGK